MLKNATAKASFLAEASMLNDCQGIAQEEVGLSQRKNGLDTKIVRIEAEERTYYCNRMTNSMINWRSAPTTELGNPALITIRLCQLKIAELRLHLRIMCTYKNSLLYFHSLEVKPSLSTEQSTKETYLPGTFSGKLWEWIPKTRSSNFCVVQVDRLHLCMLGPWAQNGVGPRKIYLNSFCHVHSTRHPCISSRITRK